MEGFVAADGGSGVKSALLAFGALIVAAPASGQSARDPLAPLAPPAATSPRPAPASSQPPGPSEATRHMLIQLDDRPDYSPPAKTDIATMTVVIRPIGSLVPTDWRGVFD